MYVLRDKRCMVGAYFFDSQVADRLFSAADPVPRG